MIRRPPRSTLFPNPTLFRSLPASGRRAVRGQTAGVATRIVYTDLDGTMVGPRGSFWHTAGRDLTADPAAALLELHRADVALRSEEHTSELQSRQYLVCRLLL